MVNIGDPFPLEDNNNALLQISKEEVEEDDLTTHTEERKIASDEENIDSPRDSSSSSDQKEGELASKVSKKVRGSRKTPSIMSNDSLEGAEIDMAENEVINQVQETEMVSKASEGNLSDGERLGLEELNFGLIKAFVTPHEGVRSSHPYSVTPEQVILSAKGYASITVTFNPSSETYNKFGTEISAYALGFMSLDCDKVRHMYLYTWIHYTSSLD